MEKQTRIYIAGHEGLIGSALVRELRRRGYRNLLMATHRELELKDALQVRNFFEETKPECVFFAAGKVGGLYANNTYRAEFIYENIMAQSHVIHQSFLSEVKKLVFFSCSSVYPKTCSQPMKEDQVLSGVPEPTNEPFAIAKIAGMKMCEAYNQQYGTAFMTVIPTNIYGVNQKYEPFNSPVIPALIRKFHKAKINEEKSVTIWGTGRPARDFLFSDDLADACLFLMENYDGNAPINIGTGRDHTVRELADIIKHVIGFKGEVLFDPSRPDGVPTKLQDITQLTRLGWRYRVDLEQGIQMMYQDCLTRDDLLT